MIWRLAAVLWCATTVLAATDPPKIVLWSWYGADDLRFLKDNDIGVAYLGLSLRFTGRDQVIPGPRAASLWLAPGTWQMAVIRCDFDTDGNDRAQFSPRQRLLAVRMIGEIATLAHAHAVQIDFDVPQSAYPFYRQLLADVRGRLRAGVFLSMTALVSWCTTPQSWLAGLPVDEIVPMAFSMGRATPAVTTMLERGATFAFPRCRGSLGVELGGPIPLHKGKRNYFFANMQRWTKETVAAARREIQP